MTWNTWIRTVEIEPSLWAADSSRLEAQTEALLRTGARIFHLDVGDEHFPEPGPVLERIAEVVHRYDGAIDVHIESEDPTSHFAAVAMAGGDSITFPFTAGDVREAVGAAHDHGLQAGIAFGPESSPEEVAAAAADADIVLCLAATSGTDLDPKLLDRVRRLSRALSPRVRIQVEGGIAHENGGELYRAGASVLVIGAAIFEREDLPRTYRRLVQALA